MSGLLRVRQSTGVAVGPTCCLPFCVLPRALISARLFRCHAPGSGSLAVGKRMENVWQMRTLFLLADRPRHVPVAGGNSHQPCAYGVPFLAKGGFLKIHCLRRRRTRSAGTPTASNPKADGSGTGRVSPWKASPTGLSNPEAKVLCVSPGVISIMLPL